MPDISALGIAVDSSQVKIATQDLGAMSGASLKVSQSLQDQISKLQNTAQALNVNNSALKINASTSDAASKSVSALASSYDAIATTIKAANDNLAAGKQVAENTGHGIVQLAENTFKLAGHLKFAAAAAFAMSPALRSIAYSAAPAAIQGVTSALKVMFPTIASGAAIMRPHLTEMLAFGARIGVPIFAAVGAFMLLKDAWSQSTEQAEKMTAVLGKATEAGMNVEFYQRLEKSAKNLKVDFDELTKSFMAFHKNATPELGGSKVQKRLDELTEAGNFKGNAGVDLYKKAQDTEERFRAISLLIRDAVAGTERLAALDIAKIAGFTPAMLRELQSNGFLFQQIISNMDTISKKDIFTDRQIAQSQFLSERTKEAVDAISKWFSTTIPGDLSSLGTNLRTVWADILESILASLHYIDQLIAKADSYVKKVPNLASLLPTGDMIRGDGKSEALNLLGDIQDTYRLIISVFLNPKTLVNPVLEELSAGLKLRETEGGSGTEPSDVWRMPNETMLRAKMRMEREQAARKDTSINPTTVGKTAEQFDKLEKSILRHAAAMEADVRSVGMGVEAHEKFRTEARLTEAALQEIKTNKKGSIEDYADRIKNAAERMGQAARALEEAKVKNEINFKSKISFFTPEDVQIATALKGLYGEDIPAAMNSSYAAAMRINHQMNEIGSTAREAFTGMGRDILTATQSGARGFAALGQAGHNALVKIQGKLMDMIMDQLWSKAFGGQGGGGFMSLLGNIFGGNGTIDMMPTSLHTGGIVGSEGLSGRHIHPAYFENAPRFHSGGLVGGEVPIIAQKGEGVFTAAQMAAMGGGGSNVQINVINNADGTKVETKQRDEGGTTIHDIIVSTINEQAANGGMDATMRSRYGIPVRGKSR